MLATWLCRASESMNLLAAFEAGLQAEAHQRAVAVGQVLLRDASVILFEDFGPG
jgi:hypothetical protein